MRLCWIPLSLVVFAPYQSSQGGWTKYSLDSCKNLLLNGQAPEGLELKQSRKGPICKCDRKKCVYMAVLHRQRYTPFYWAYKILDDHGHNFSPVDLLNRISSWYISSLVVGTLLLRERTAVPPRVTDSSFSHPVTHIVSGVAQVEDGSAWKTMEVRPNVHWVAYHHTATTGHIYHGAMVKKDRSTQGDRGWVQHTLVQLQEMLAERYSTVKPVTIFPSLTQLQKFKARVTNHGKEEKFKGAHSSPKNKSGIEMDVSVQMEYVGPLSLDNKLVRQQDVFQVNILQTEGSSKRTPDVEVMVIGEITDVSKEIPTPERLTRLTTSSLSSVGRMYGFKAVSDGDDTGFKLTNGFIGLSRKKRDFLTKSQHEIQPALVRLGQGEYAGLVDNEGLQDNSEEGDENSGEKKLEGKTKIVPPISTLPPETDSTEKTEGEIKNVKYPNTLSTSKTESQQDETEIINRTGENMLEKPKATAESLILTTNSHQNGENIDTQEPRTMPTPTPSKTSESLQTEYKDYTEIPVTKSIDEPFSTVEERDHQTTTNEEEPSPTTAQESRLMTNPTKYLPPEISASTESIQTVCTEETEDPLTESIGEHSTTTESLQTEYRDYTEIPVTKSIDEPFSTVEKRDHQTTTNEEEPSSTIAQESRLMTNPTKYLSPEMSATTESIQTECEEETEDPLTESIGELSATTESLQTECTEETDNPPTESKDEPSSTVEEINKPTTKNGHKPSVDQEPTFMTEPDKYLPAEPSTTTESIETECTEETENPPTESIYKPSDTDERLGTKHETDLPDLPVCKGLVHRTDAGTRHCRERSLMLGNISNETIASGNIATEQLYITRAPDPNYQGLQSVTIWKDKTDGPSKINKPDREKYIKHKSTTDNTNLSSSNKDEHFYYFNGIQTKVKNNIYPKEGDPQNSF